MYSKSTINELVAALDSDNEEWNMWRAATGQWCIRRGGGRDDPASREIGADTIGEALQMALAKKRLPVIPRCPARRHFDWIKRDSGSRPYVVQSDGYGSLYLRRRKDAVEAVAELIHDQNQAIDSWNQRHHEFTESHTEGADFYWKK